MEHANDNGRGPSHGGSEQPQVTVAQVLSARGAGDGVHDPLIALLPNWLGEEPTYVLESAEGVTTFPGDTGPGSDKRADEFLHTQLRKIAGDSA